MPFGCLWGRASPEKVSEEGSQPNHADDDSEQVGAHSIKSVGIEEAEQDHRLLGLQRAQAQAHAESLSANSTLTNRPQPGGEGGSESLELDSPTSSQPRRLGFEPGLAQGAAAAEGRPRISTPKTAAEAQNWRWLLQQEELNSLPPAPRTAAEANAVRRQAAEQFDLSTVKREELHLLSAEELGG